MKRSTTLLVLGCCLLSGCDGIYTFTDDKVKVFVTYQANEKASPMRSVYAFSGGDKSFVSTIEPMETHKFLLLPGADDNPDINLVFDLNGQRRYWQGPSFSVGDRYLIRVNITQNGDIDSRFCHLPCSIE